jgi:AcrR family transcriptional regulator
MDTSSPDIRSELGKVAREEIVRAAAEVFMEFGFAASTIDAVANRLGATKGRIYHYFGSKADLFFEVQIAAMERLRREVEPLARGPGSPAERLRAMAFRHTMIMLEHLPIQKVSVQGLERQLLGAAIGRHTRKLRDIIRRRDEYEQLFAEVIDEGVRLGLFVDLPPRLATKPFFGALNWLTVWYTPRRLQSKNDLAELARMLAEFVMRGISKGTQT